VNDIVFLKENDLLFFGNDIVYIGNYTFCTVNDIYLIHGMTFSLYGE